MEQELLAPWQDIRLFNVDKMESWSAYWLRLVTALAQEQVEENQKEARVKVSSRSWKEYIQ